jgi:glycosyltransferase involved in cell wall biosynthesis
VRILFVAENAMSSFTTYLSGVAGQLAAAGHEVHVLRCGTNILPGDEVHNGVAVHYRRRPRLRGLSRARRVPLLRVVVEWLVSPSFPPWTSPFVRLSLACANYREFRRLGIDFDVIEVPDHQAEGLLFALLRSRPVVVELHGPVRLMVRYWGFAPSARLRVSDWLERLTARLASVTVAPSHLAADALVALGWRSAADARVVPHALDPRPWAAIPSAALSGPIVLAVGEVGDLKGSDVLISAMADVHAPSAEVVFVGPPARRRDGSSAAENLALLAEELGVRARFVGFVGRGELLAWYAQARVVVVPSRFDSFSQVGLEALASGRPVVCSTGAGLHEMAADAEGAIVVVPSEDAGAHARAIEALLHDPFVARDLGERGRRFVQRQWTQLASRRERVYRDAIERWHPLIRRSCPSRRGR